MVSSLAPQASAFANSATHVIVCIERRTLNRNSTPWVVKTRGMQGRFILRLGLTARLTDGATPRARGSSPRVLGQTAQHRVKPCPLIHGSRARPRERRWPSRGVDHAGIDHVAAGHFTSPNCPASLSSLDGGRFDAWSLYDQGQGSRAEDARRRPAAELHAGFALDRGM